MLGEQAHDLASSDACLVDFAQVLTARPWTFGTADIKRLSEAGFSRASIVLAIGLVAMFNYLTRVADGTGIEADYGSVLPQFVYRGATESAPQPEPAAWPPVEDSLQLLSLVAGAHEAWCRWREYVLDGPSPLAPATRYLLRSIAARNACDGAAYPAGNTDSVAGYNTPVLAGALSEFAEKLCRTPWLISAADADALRSIGLDDLAILHVIAVVAYQSAESRLRIGLSALGRCTELTWRLASRDAADQ